MSQADIETLRATMREGKAARLEIFPQREQALEAADRPEQDVSA